MADTPDLSNPPVATQAVTRVALVGHCGFDSGSLKQLARQALPDAEVLMVNHQSDLDAAARPDTLLWINRQLDGRFDAADSLDMIRQLAAQPQPPQIMLVSNYPDAQDAAVQAGAMPGFGKNDLGDPKLTQRLATLASAKV